MSDGNKVIMRNSVASGRGINIYVVPKGVKIPNTIKEPSEKLPNGDEFHEKYWKAWFWEISKKCCC